MGGMSDSKFADTDKNLLKMPHKPHKAKAGEEKGQDKPDASQPQKRKGVTSPSSSSA